MKKIAAIILSCALMSCATLTTNQQFLLQLSGQTATSVALEALGPTRAATLAPQMYVIATAIRSLESGQIVTASQLQSAITLFTQNTKVDFIGVEVGAALASVWQTYYPNGNNKLAALEALATGVEAGAGGFMPSAHHRHK
jgi:hypothetical protein